jgi:hypothetical protein
VVVKSTSVGNAFVVSALGLIVAVLVALEGVLHHGEQWKNYRTAEQAAGHERIQYVAGIGSYTRLMPERAFRKFVERVEATIKAENSATLSVMTTPSQSEDAQG